MEAFAPGRESAASAPGEAERAGIAQKARQGIPRDSGGVFFPS